MTSLVWTLMLSSFLSKDLSRLMFPLVWTFSPWFWPFGSLGSPHLHGSSWSWNYRNCRRWCGSWTLFDLCSSSSRFCSESQTSLDSYGFLFALSFFVFFVPFEVLNLLGPLQLSNPTWYLYGVVDVLSFDRLFGVSLALDFFVVEWSFIVVVCGMCMLPVGLLYMGFRHTTWCWDGCCWAATCSDYVVTVFIKLEDFWWWAWSLLGFISGLFLYHAELKDIDKILMLLMASCSSGMTLFLMLSTVS